MSIFKEDIQSKRVIFNIRMDLSERLDKAKKDSRAIGKRLDLDTVIDKALEKFLKKAEKKIAELKKKKGVIDSAGGEDHADEESENNNDLLIDGNDAEK
jgi:hypothetical protein